MKNVCFLTLRDRSPFMIYDQLLHEPLRRRGFLVEEIAWDDPSADWSRYEVVVIRSPWDYQARPAAFLSVLAAISSQTRLENPLEIVQWNLDKKYLLDLENRGIPVVPARYFENFEPEEVRKSLSAYGTAVIKPAISANADDTYVLNDSGRGLEALSARFQNRSFLVQPFLPAIQTEGEYSVFFFGGTLSHTILKTPKSGDFRVQEEHGGRLQLVKNPGADLLKAAVQCWEAFPEPLLYGRVDLVRHDGRWLLMEVELIEPSLYFNMDPESPERFATVFASRFS